MNNDVLYLETDEDITSAIDKLNKSKATSVSIVAPKRSTLIQSLINLKLLKKAADDTDKELILVTGDRTATQLAGRIGLPVAATLKGKASVPTVASAEPDDAIDVIEEDSEPTGSVDEPVALSAAAGVATGAALAGAASAKAAEPKPVPVPTAPVVTTRTLDDDDVHVEKEPVAAGGTKKMAKVPDFNVLQKRLLWVGGALALIIAFFVGSYFWTSATVKLYAKGQAVQTDITFTVDPNAKQPDLANSVVVGQSLTSSRNVTGTVTATGTKDVGTNAKGNITVSNSYDTSSHAMPAGTKFVSSDGKTFLSTGDAVVPGATPTLINGQLGLKPGTVGVSVQADQAGDTYNLGPTSYSIPLFANPKITGSGSQMSGGTSKKVTIVTQADVDKATADALAKDKPDAQKDLEAKVASGYAPLPDSFTQTPGPVTANPTVGAEGTTGTITTTVAYSMLSYSKSDLAALVRDQQQQQVGADSQIYDDGIATATITAGDKSPSGSQKFRLSATAYAGQKIDTTALAKSLAGKKYGDAMDIAAKQPGVDHVEINISPAWSSSMPKRAQNIHVTVKVAPKS